MGIFGIGGWDNRDCDNVVGVVGYSAKGHLRCKASAKLTSNGKRQSSQGLEEGAFTGTLIPNNNELEVNSQLGKMPQELGIRQHTSGRLMSFPTPSSWSLSIISNCFVRSGVSKSLACNLSDRTAMLGRAGAGSKVALRGWVGR